MASTKDSENDEQLRLRSEVLVDVLHWVWSWLLQVHRLASSTEAQGKGNNRNEVRKSFSHTSYDEHILAVVGWNLARAIHRASEFYPSIKLSEEKSEALRLLRHLYEHWDEQRSVFRDSAAPKKQSAEQFATLFPDGKPWSITYTKYDWSLGGVVGVNNITTELVRIEKQAFELEQQLR